MREENFYNATLYYRLVALWVVCEAFAGGLMHAAKLPFTGMIVSSLAVACIMLIAYHVPSRTAILKATLTVAFFKLLLSPHSPPTAYIAVMFQGYIGYIFFNHRKHFMASAITVAILALVESALQRLLVLLLIYGNSFWDAFDTYLKKIVGGSFENYTTAAAIVYVVIHAIVGLFVGVVVTKLIIRSEQEKDVAPFLLKSTALNPVDAIAPKRRRHMLRSWLSIVWFIVFSFYLQAIFDPTNAVLPVNKIFLIIVRSLLIILTWYVVLAPLAMTLIKRFIKKQEQRQNLPIAEIERILPDIKLLFLRSWQLSRANSGFARLKFFIWILFINVVHAKPQIESIK